MRWLIKDYARISPFSRRYLRAATPQDKDDYMYSAASNPSPRKGDYLAIVLYSGSHLLGWAMCDFRLSKNSHCLRTYVYVKKNHRRKGYGSMLMRKAREAAKRRGRDLRVCPWNKQSKKFFQAVNITTSEVAPGYNLYKL